MLGAFWVRGAEARGSEKGAKDRQECSLFVCELYSNSNVFTRLLFTRYIAKLNIQVGCTIFKTKFRPKFSTK